MCQQLFELATLCRPQYSCLVFTVALYLPVVMKAIYEDW